MWKHCVSTGTKTEQYSKNNSFFVFERYIVYVSITLLSFWGDGGDLETETKYGIFDDFSDGVKD